MIFDGKSFAAVIEKKLKEQVSGMAKKPRLVILMVGEDLASEKYVQMKKQMGERIGVEVEVLKLSDLEALKQKLTGSLDADGVMVQLPVPGASKEQVQELLRLIPIEKDIDGLNPDNGELIESGEQTFIPATVKAVERILDEAFRETEMDIDENLKVGVVGAKGNVGRPLVTRMRRFGIEVGEFDLGSNLDDLRAFAVVISCTGQAGLIKKSMIKDGVIAIDVGFPVGDLDPEIQSRASFFTPVPGGVGPVTVACLMENVVENALR